MKDMITHKFILCNCRCGHCGKLFYPDDRGAYANKDSFRARLFEAGWVRIRDRKTIVCDRCVQKVMNWLDEEDS